MKTFMKILKAPFKKIYRFFLWASGADLEILDKAPTDKNKFFGIGGTIIFTALMATFAGGYAFYTVFKDPGLSIFFGFFWGALIFNLDRYIVSTFGAGDGKKTISRQELIEAAPRLVMAMLLGIIIATPLELKLFESEINAEIARQNLVTVQEQNSNATARAEEQNIYYANEISTSRSRVDARNTELSANKEKRDQAYDKYMCELNGTCGTGKPGEGPVFREAKENYRILNEEYLRLENDYLEKNKEDNNTIQTYRKIMEDNLTAAIVKMANLETQTQSRNGLLARLEAQNNLSYKEVPVYKNENGVQVVERYETEKTVVWFAAMLITILFVFIEIAPILFKMMTERGPYDDMLERIKHEAKVKQMLLQSNINEEINTAVKVNADKNSQKLNAELMANKILLESIAKAQAEIAEVAIEEWKKEQLALIRVNPSIMIK